MSVVSAITFIHEDESQTTYRFKYDANGNMLMTVNDVVVDIIPAEDLATLNEEEDGEYG